MLLEKDSSHFLLSLELDSFVCGQRGCASAKGSGERHQGGGH